MISLEQYADLCALMADTGTDEAKQNAIAAAHGVSASEWKESKEGYTKRMSDPADMGKTALAFMPLYQAAQSRARGGKEPCTLETYSKIHVHMAYRKGPDGNKINYQIVLAEHGFTHQSWLECEGYWTPRVASDKDPKWDAALGMKFRQLVQQYADELAGIKR
jgi:hypothetical protein